ncbi:MAG: hypothetical protein ACYS7Y_03910 [Planctomycetota bacterium]|jgi:hypothetical protein
MIHNEALQRIASSTIRPSVIVDTLMALDAALEASGSDSGQVPIDYQDINDEVKEGDLVPFLVIGLRPATLPEVEETPDADDS